MYIRLLENGKIIYKRKYLFITYIIKKKNNDICLQNFIEAWTYGGGGGGLLNSFATWMPWYDFRTDS